jgi:hypothetical protein
VSTPLVSVILPAYDYALPAGRQDPVRAPAEVCSIAQWREQQLDQQLRVTPHALAGGA